MSLRRGGCLSSAAPLVLLFASFLALAPRCGDEFINLAVNKAKKTLTNSYIVDNKYRTCQAKY